MIPIEVTSLSYIFETPEEYSKEVFLLVTDRA